MRRGTAKGSGGAGSDAREEGAAHEVVELPDRLASLIARRDAERMQEGPCV